MKNKMVKIVLAIGIGSLFVSCNGNTGESAASVAVDKEQVKKDIQAKENEFAKVYNSGELKEIGYYADDATSFYQNRPPLVGRDSIIAFLKSDLVDNSNVITFTTNDVFVSSDGNQVVEVGYFKLADSANNIINSGNYMSLFEKRNGKYVSVRDMSASDIPVK
jgi:ketosteroid isomerase-like protein